MIICEDFFLEVHVVGEVLSGETSFMVRAWIWQWELRRTNLGDCGRYYSIGSMRRKPDVPLLWSPMAWLVSWLCHPLVVGLEKFT